MMENLVVKVWFEREGGADPEIRRFTVPNDASDADTTYNYICDKVTELFSELKHGQFAMYWKDNDGDIVTFSTQEELGEALSSATDSVLKVIVKYSKLSNSSGRVAAPDCIETCGRFGKNTDKRGRFENMEFGTMPPRFRRWMRNPRGRYQYGNEPTSLHTEQANIPNEIHEDGIDCTSDCRGKRRAILRQQRMWLPEGRGHGRRRQRYAMALSCKEDQNEGESPKDDLGTDNRSPSPRHKGINKEERVSRRVKRRQQMLQELQKQPQPQSADFQPGLYPRWRSMRSPRGSEHARVRSSVQQGYLGLTGGCRGFRAHRGRSSQDQPEKLMRTEAEQQLQDSGFPSCLRSIRRGAWRRMEANPDFHHVDDAHFASCQRRRARCMRKETILKERGRHHCKALHTKNDDVLIYPQRRVKFQGESYGKQDIQESESPLKESGPENSTGNGDQEDTENVREKDKLTSGPTLTGMDGQHGPRMRRRHGRRVDCFGGRMIARNRFKLLSHLGSPSEENGRKEASCIDEVQSTAPKFTNRCLRKCPPRYKKMQRSCGKGVYKAPSHSLKLRLKPRQGSSLAVYRLRVLRRLHRLRYLQGVAKTGSQQPFYGRGGCRTRRGMFHQKCYGNCSDQSVHRGLRLVNFPARCGMKRRSSVCGPMKQCFDSGNARKIKWTRLVQMRNGIEKKYSSHPQMSLRRTLCSRPTRHVYGRPTCYTRCGFGQKIFYPRHGFGSRNCHRGHDFGQRIQGLQGFAKSPPVTPHFQLKDRSPRRAKLMHLVKTHHQKQRGMGTFGRQRCGRPVPLRFGYNKWAFRPLYNIPVY